MLYNGVTQIENVEAGQRLVFKTLIDCLGTDGLVFLRICKAKVSCTE